MKNTKELRKFLLDQMQGVLEGEVEIGTAKAITNLSQQVYNSLLIEIKYAKAVQDLGDAAAIKTVEFGDD